MPLPSVPTCIVVDTETTGIGSAGHRVIEIGAVRIEDGEIGERFETLVNPGVLVPRRITRITGITTRDLVGAPGPAEAFERFLAFARGGPMVAHNASFDRRFIEAELARLGLESPFGEWLCTVRLSRRILPGLPSHGLASVARFLGIPFETRHRALADADVTALVLLELAERASEHGITDLHGLMALQAMRYARTGVVPAHVERLRTEVVPALPDGPGVYHMLDARDRVLYVGKATSLRDRVGSYFVAVQAKDLHHRELVRQVRGVRVVAAETEIEARVMEARTILALKPPFNRAQREPGRRAWLRVGEERGRRSVSVHSWRGGDDATWIGPLAGKAEARGLAEAIGALTGLPVVRSRPRSTWTREVAAREARAASRVAGAVGAVSDDWTPDDLPGLARGPVSEAMHAAAAELAFEEARILRDWLEGLERLAADGSGAERLAGDVAAVVDGEILLVRDGRMLGTMGRSGVAKPGLLEILGKDDHPPAEGPEARRIRNDETWMLAHWIGQSGAATVERRCGETADAFADRILETLEREPAPGAYREASIPS